MADLIFDAEGLVLFAVFSAIIIAFSSLGTASAFTETKPACVQVIEVRCAEGADSFELPKSCMNNGFNESLNQELDSISNNSVDCSELDSGKLRSVERPPEPVNNLSTFLPIIGLLIFSSAVVIPLLLAVHYGEDFSEKILLTGYWLLNLTSILTTGFVSLSVVELMVNRSNFPTNLALLLGFSSTVVLSSVVAWIVAKLIKIRSEVSDRRIALVFYISAFIFWVSILLIIFFTSGQLATYY